MNDDQSASSAEGISCPQAAPPPYHRAAPVARYFKAILQMVIGCVGVAAVLWHTGVAAVLWRTGHNHDPQVIAQLDAIKQEVFQYIGLALAVAAAVELAYTLFTHGPDEALDPLMLGLSAALILQLGNAKDLSWQQGVATLAYVAALGLLFAIRDRLTDLKKPKPWSPSWRMWWHRWRTWWQRLRHLLPSRKRHQLSSEAPPMGAPAGGAHSSTPERACSTALPGSESSSAARSQRT